jgi:hypothetical protein
MIRSSNDLKVANDPSGSTWICIAGLSGKVSYRGAAFLLALICCGSSLAQGPAASLPEISPVVALPDTSLALPFAPVAYQTSIAVVPPKHKYSQIVEPDETAKHFSSMDKMMFSFAEVARPVTLLAALYSASYEQIFNTDPKYGRDAGAYGEKFGVSILLSASVRVFSDGILASAFHQDPRYYRIAEGSVIHRGLRSAMQALVCRGDDGANQINFSGIGGRAAAAALTVTYYPQNSISATEVASTFLISIATDAAGNVALEFIPGVIRRFPIMQVLRIE